MLSEQDKRAVESMALCQFSVEELKYLFPKFPIKELENVLDDINNEFYDSKHLHSVI